MKDKKKLIISIIIIIVVISVLGISAFAGWNYFKKKTTGGTSIFSEVVKDGVREKASIKSKMNGCSSEYEKVLNLNKFDFANCMQGGVRTGNASNEEFKPKTNNLVIVLDASGSMKAQIDGKSKMEIAKEAAKEYIAKLGKNKNINVSIVAYGHKGSNSTAHKQQSCAGIEEVYYLGPVNVSVAQNKISQFRATGWTPIAGSLKKAQEVLAKKPVDGENFVLLISDGKETCGGDPIATVRELNESNLHITANVIGFDVSGDDEKQLRAVAEAGGGDYFSVKNAQDFELAFQRYANMLQRAKYTLGRTVEQIYDISYAMLTYNQCSTMLYREETAVMLDIYDSKIVSERCAKDVDNMYQKRKNEIYGKLKDDFEMIRKEFNKVQKSTK